MSISSPKPLDEDPRGPVLRNLENLSTTEERITALKDLQFTYEEIGEAVGGLTPEAIRGWQKRNAAPRRKNGDALDDLRCTVLILLEGGIEPKRIKQWFVSYPRPGAETPRPIDVLGSDPRAVASAAVAQVHEDLDEMCNILDNARRQDATSPPPAPVPEIHAEALGEKARKRRVERSPLQHR